MKTLIVPEIVLAKMLDKWMTKQGGHPEWRVPRCWGCGRRLWFRMWHVFFARDSREAHLCRRCGKPWEVEL